MNVYALKGARPRGLNKYRFRYFSSCPPLQDCNDYRRDSRALRILPARSWSSLSPVEMQIGSRTPDGELARPFASGLADGRVSLAVIHNYATVRQS